ncbi:MAG TPA: polysaccharide deacetylase family protein [Chloroflexota bacterium]|nr:polysaccharide deacetylase family protein [Chloroflexota bacterium]
MNTGEQHGLYDYTPIVERPSFSWPGEARVALWVVPNIEHQVFVQANGGVDVPAFSRGDYGNRVGVWRIMETLDRFGIRGTVALNSSVCRHYPQVVRACLERGWELIGHGITNSDGLFGKSAEEQREMVDSTLDEIEQFARQRPVGWLSPGLRESADTLDVLRQAGLEYTCDWVNDDLPYRFANGLWSMPYTNTLNDQRLMREPVFGLDDFRLMIRRSFETLYREGASLPRVMCIALHPPVTGMPGRIGVLEDVLEFICSHPLVWKATGSEIVEHFKAESTGVSMPA